MFTQFVNTSFLIVGMCSTILSAAAPSNPSASCRYSSFRTVSGASPSGVDLCDPSSRPLSFVSVATSARASLP